MAELAMAPRAAAKKGLLGGLEREEALSRGADEPGWLRSFRAAAWSAYESLPLPTRALEEWRYTEVSQLALDEVRPVEGGISMVPGAARALLEGREAAGTALLVGAAVAEITLDPALAEQGVILTDLATAARVHPELVRKHLGSAVPADRDKLAALNGAMWTAGLFLYVPRNVRVEKPIRVARWLPEAGIAVFPRTLIVAEDNSHVAYVDEFGSPDFEEATLSLGVVEIVARAGADVQHVALQQWGRGVRHLSIQKTLAGRDANLDTLVVNLGATVARVDLAAQLEGPGSRSDMLGLYFARDDQHFDHNTRQDHVSDHANSDLLYKGALYDRSMAIFRGIIRVHPGAQRTDAYQTNRNLLLSPDAQAVSLPNLEIEADDVKCSHAATVGQLDEEELFYLLSRGLTPQQAERLVIFGFFGEVLDRLPLPGVVEELKAAIEAKIR
ncbi:MAG TPA: Fe-S cluster assembly protein SufD [Longimicrobiales bacterium]|nr:Fe-S cluster assembly protein SufD [Longimicrobiales bacterium]